MSLFAISIAILVGLAIMAVFAGILSLTSQERLTDRLREAEFDDVVADTGGSSRTGISGASRQRFKQLDSQLQARGLGNKLAKNLLQADIKLTPPEYVLISIGITLIGALLGFAVSGQLVSAVVAGIICMFMPGAFVRWRKAKRRRSFANQLVDILIQIVGSLRSGYGILQSIDLAAQQMPDPAGPEFARVVQEVQLGQPLITALTHLADRIENEDLVMIIAAITTSQQVGGNLAEILDTVSETIRERVRIKQEIQVLTAQQAISGYILVFLPVALAAFLLILNPSYQMRLFTPGITLCIPGGAALGIMIGFVIMRRIIDIEV